MSSRRQFMAGASLSWLAAKGIDFARAAEHAHAQQASAASGAGPQFKVFTPAQARSAEAFAASIVPSAPGSPGAREAGAVYFMDYALAGFMAGERAAVLAGLDTLPAGFADAGDEARAAHLRTIEKTPFFATMQFLTLAGLLADPRYGGNRDHLGWKLMGFEDTHAFAPPFGYYDREAHS